MTNVQTQTKVVILQKTLSKAGYVAVGNIFEQQLNMTVFLPVVRKACQQAALPVRCALGRVQHGTARG